MLRGRKGRESTYLAGRNNALRGRGRYGKN